MTRYITGDNVERGAGQSKARSGSATWTWLHLPEGALKNLNVKWRNATARGNIAASNNVDENRLIVSYTIPLM